MPKDKKTVDKRFVSKYKFQNLFMKKYIIGLLILILFNSCGKQKTSQSSQYIEALPFTLLELNDLSAFQSPPESWQIFGDAVVNRSKKRAITGIEGTGVLLNTANKDTKENIFTNFEHGDIELELDVMMPKESNSGIYLQGRYEIQLFDSWTVKKSTFSDMGGIYQRWNKKASKEERGYEGHNPPFNAAKAPGLWQHVKIKFTAPTFNEAGEKTGNAKFDEVWLNGALLHENIEVTGPTRAAAFDTETPLAPIMIQGDHGPVAIKNIKYKLYKKQAISLSDLSFKEYEEYPNTSKTKLPDLNLLEEVKNEEVQSVSLEMLKRRGYKNLFSYAGKLNVPETGSYLFNFKIHDGGVGALVIDNDTITSNIISLKKGASVPFSLTISKTKPFIGDFELFLEGPGIKKQSFDAGFSLAKRERKPNKSMQVRAKKEAIVQRSFLRHRGETRTHCVSVGTPEGIHYAYDMNLGSLLSVWSGDDFFDATQMWSARGFEQFGRTGSFTMPMFGYTEFALLKDSISPWVYKNENSKFVGYDLEKNGRPILTSIIEGTKITNEFSPVLELGYRGLNRIITTKGTKELFHKINEGESIKLLEDGTYIINGESYFVKFSNENSLKPFIRHSNGMDELLVEVPSGEQTINYTIIW